MRLPTTISAALLVFVTLIQSRQAAAQTPPAPAPAAPTATAAPPAEPPMAPMAPGSAAPAAAPPPTVAPSPAASAPAAAPAASTATPAAIPEPTWPVGGIYTVADTKDLGKLTGLSFFNGVKVRGWLDTYYEANFNNPNRDVINASPGVVRANTDTIQGRTFDVHNRNFTLSLAEIEVEKVPDVGGAGFKLDLAFGETSDIIYDTIVAAGGLLTPADRVVQHASVSYLADVGRGLRFDMGKFVTHIGGETIETVKNWNYSHSFFYTYAIPFQNSGLHISYPWSDTFYTDIYVLNSWNNTIAINDAPTAGPAIGWTATPWLSFYVNYLGGPQQKNNTSNLRHLVDAQVFLGPLADNFNMGVNFDYGTEKIPNPAGPGTSDVKWWGVSGTLRYKLADWFEPSARVEYYDDSDGFTTGFAQKLLGVTLTLNTKLGLGKSNGGMLLLRPEVRFDSSSAVAANTHFFLKGDGTPNPAAGMMGMPTGLPNTDTQTTVGLGATYLF